MSALATLDVTKAPRLVSAGYASARAVTRAHAKSFSFASALLFGDRRRAAFALYAFCRRLDDLVDLDSDTGERGAAAVGRAELPRRLADARELVRGIYRGHLGAVPVPFREDEVAAFADTVRRFRIPEEPFQDLVSGMEMDLALSRYPSYRDLELYCYRVAGTVGLMLTPVLGYRSDAAFGPAADLGKAMQLTNILRDVAEDYGRGRIYLPEDERARFGVSEDQLHLGRVDDAFRGLMRLQIDRARALYASAGDGVRLLDGFGSHAVVRLMGALYGDILRVIEERDYDVFAGRASVPTSRKLALAAGVLFRPQRSRPPALPARATREFAP